MRRLLHHGERGYIMVLALLVAALMLSMGGAALTTAVGDSRLGHQRGESTQALYLAAAGIEDVINDITGGATFPGGTSTYGPFSLGAGSYSVQVTFTGPSTYSFVSTGTVHGSSRTVQAAGTTSGSSQSSYVVFGFGNHNDTWNPVNISGAYTNGTAYPATVQFNANLNIGNGQLGSVINGHQVNASVTAVGKLQLGNATLQTPNCTASGSPWQSPDHHVTLYGNASGCGSTVAHTASNYASLMAQAKLGGANGLYTTTCPFQGSGSKLVLSQPGSPNPYNNYVYFIDCSGYGGSNKQVEVGTDANGLAGTFTLVVYANGNTRVTGLIVDNFNAQPGAGLGIISDVPNQNLNGVSVDAFMRFDATSGKANLQNGTSVTGSLTAWDISVGGGPGAAFTVSPVPPPPGFTTVFTVSSWSN